MKEDFLNVLYSIDIDLVVFMVNWLFFIIYSKGKNDDIYDFFNNNFWSFFYKCYYSFIIDQLQLFYALFITMKL